MWSKNVTNYKDLINTASAKWDDDYGNYSGYGKPYYESPKPKRKHEFTPILLINSTVFNCKLCGAKKEECLTEYCEENEDIWDTGGW